MGWWSETILGGDEPLDTMYDIVTDFCGFTEELSSWGNKLNEPGIITIEISSEEDLPKGRVWDDDLPAIKKGLEHTPIDSFFQFIGKKFTPRIAAECVAYAHMASGAAMPESIRELALIACESERYLTWGRPGARAAQIAHFHSMIWYYDGLTPQRPPELGLFERFGQLAMNRDKGDQQRVSIIWDRISIHETTTEEKAGLLKEEEKNALIEFASGNVNFAVHSLKDVHVYLMVRGLACISDGIFEMTYDGEEVARFFMDQDESPSP